MIHVEKKYYYIHKPTGRFVYFSSEFVGPNYQSELLGYYKVVLYFSIEFNPDILFCAKNAIEETLEIAQYNEDSWVFDLENGENDPPEFISNPVVIDDFELKECIITYSSREN